MAKGKRKSEGDLIPASKKSRKTVQVSDGDEDEEAQQSSDRLFITEKFKSKPKHVKKVSAPKSRRSEPVQKLARLVDDDEDDGNEEGDGAGGMETQDFLGFVELQQKKKMQATKSTADFMAKFTSMVDEDEQVMLQQIDALSREAIERDNGFLARFQLAFEASRPKPVPSEDDLPIEVAATTSFASLQERSLQLITNAETIIQRFSQANDMTQSIRLDDFVRVEAFKADAIRVSQVLEAGKNVGLRRAETMLTGVVSEVLEEDEDEDERHVERDFYGDRLDKNSTGWGVVARKMDKAARKMVKSLPTSSHLRIEH